MLASNLQVTLQSPGGGAVEKEEPYESSRLPEVRSAARGEGGQPHHGHRRPFACSLLADLGAEVIGVESPRGRDTSRPTNQALQGWGTQMERRNTRSLCMNVKDGAGRAWFFELLKQADILVDGFRGGQMAKWGMTDEALWEVNPKLTIAHISGFGQTGDPAYVSRASFDGIGQAYGASWK